MDFELQFFPSQKNWVKNGRGQDQNGRGRGEKWAWPITRCLKLRVITRRIAAPVSHSRSIIK